ncbi:unnamed protein product [Tenebrio molitor]|nr:unnamed protein product [Tenebrio molitor]
MITITVLFKYNPKLFKSKSEIPIFPGCYYTYRFLKFPLNIQDSYF